MGISRIVNTDFWIDENIIDYYSPEDKYFWLYLLTNPQTRQLGIYKLPKKIMAFQLGYDLDTVLKLIDRFENNYKVIKYSKKTQEIAILNYIRYSIIKGGKPVIDCVAKDISQVKDKALLGYMYHKSKNTTDKRETVTVILEMLSSYENKMTMTNDNDNDSIVDDTPHDTPTIRIIEEEPNIDFETFWDAYPKKQARKSAVKAWDKIKKLDFNLIMDALKKQKQTTDWNKDNGQFIPLPATWINNERWKDEVVEAKKFSAEGREIKDGEFDHIKI